MGDIAVSITLTRYNEPDAVIANSIRHALAQEFVSGEVLYIEQSLDSQPVATGGGHSHLEFRTIRKRMSGLSEARNLALDEARYPLVLFLDADALADPGWARHLATALSLDRCAVAGSKVVPGWPGTAPLFARSSILRDQYSLLDLGTATLRYHRVVGAGFGVDKSKLPALRFDATLGRRQGRLFGGEESDYCNRARALGFDVMYVGAARVVHMIEPARCRWKWILKRMIYAGHGRASLGGTPRASTRPGLYDWLFLPIYMPFYALGWLWGKSGRPGKVKYAGTSD